MASFSGTPHSGDGGDLLSTTLQPRTGAHVLNTKNSLLSERHSFRTESGCSLSFEAGSASKVTNLLIEFLSSMVLRYTIAQPHCSNSPGGNPDTSQAPQASFSCFGFKERLRTKGVAANAKPITAIVATATVNCFFLFMGPNVNELSTLPPVGGRVCSDEPLDVRDGGTCLRSN